MASFAQSPPDRQRIYRRLEARNRLVGTLRLMLPALGVIGALAVIAQVYIASVARDFGISAIRLAGDRLAVDTPHYSGVASDGTQYDMSAESASAPVRALDQIDLVNAVVVLKRANGTQMIARAPAALMDTTTSTVTIKDITHVEDSGGVTGTMYDTFIDWTKQSLKASGPVHFVYPDGSIIDAHGLTFDPRKSVWTFNQADLTLPSPPPKEQPAVTSPAPVPASRGGAQ